MHICTSRLLPTFQSHRWVPRSRAYRGNDSAGCTPIVRQFEPSPPFRWQRWMSCLLRAGAIAGIQPRRRRNIPSETLVPLPSQVAYKAYLSNGCVQQKLMFLSHSICIYEVEQDL